MSNIEAQPDKGVEWNAAIEAAALLFPQPYVEYCGEDIQRMIHALSSAPSQQSAEPVAWMMTQDNGGRVGQWFSSDPDAIPVYKGYGATITPLYAAPQSDSGYKVPEGWKLVPFAYTPEMRAAWDRTPFDEDLDIEFNNAYRAMISAAPVANKGDQE